MFPGRDQVVTKSLSFEGTQVLGGPMDTHAEKQLIPYCTGGVSGSTVQKDWETLNCLQSEEFVVGTGQEGQASIPCGGFVTGNGVVNAQPCSVARRDAGVVTPM